MLCLVVIYDGIKGTICDGLPIVLQNVCVKAKKKIKKRNTSVHYILKVFVFMMKYF